MGYTALMYAAAIGNRNEVIRLLHKEALVDTKQIVCENTKLIHYND